MVSQINLDQGVNEMFCGSSDEICYGSIRVQPIIFQDDILRLGDSLSSVRAGNVKIDSVMNQKKLKFNSDKTGYIMMGKEVQKNRDRLLIKRSPIECGKFLVKEKISDKYLGDILHQGGLAESVLATVKDREGKVKAAMLESAAIVDDFRSQCIGGFMAALDIWEMAIVPTLLNNAGTWTEIDEDTEKRLEDLQLFYIRLILQVPVSTPKTALRSETGLMSMKHRIEQVFSSRLWMRRPWHARSTTSKWPGLAAEAKTICDRLGCQQDRVFQK